MPDPRIVGAPPSGETPVKVYDVVGVSPRRELRVLFLSDDIKGAQHHWEVTEQYPAGRSRICQDEWGDCPRCKDHVRQVWLGYAAVLQMPHKTRAVLRVGPETALEILRVAGKRVTLRGLHLLLTSAIEGKTARAIVEPLHEINFSTIPLAHELGHTVKTVLGCTRLPDLWSASQIPAEGDK